MCLDPRFVLDTNRTK